MQDDISVLFHAKSDYLVHLPIETIHIDLHYNQDMRNLIMKNNRKGFHKFWRNGFFQQNIIDYAKQQKRVLHGDIKYFLLMGGVSVDDFLKANWYYEFVYGKEFVERAFEWVEKYGLDC